MPSTRSRAIYGSEAGNLALRCVARGGIYLGGGIAPRILPALRSAAFENGFRDKEPRRALLSEIPVWVVLDDRTALWGRRVTPRCRSASWSEGSAATSPENHRHADVVDIPAVAQSHAITQAPLFDETKGTVQGHCW
ncbi:MAG: glucokinase [Candidatus Eisenbacteria bacterium]